MHTARYREAVVIERLFRKSTVEDVKHHLRVLYLTGNNLTPLMTLEIFLRYVHFISIFGIVGTLVSEHLLLKKELTRAEIGRIARIDAIYGFAALTLIAAGLTLWLGSVGKPAVYYSKNWVFHLKITCFALIGILSIYPTLFFIKQRKGDPNDIVNIPKSIFMMLRLELTLLFIIPLLAGLMSRGVGFFGN
jgi:putative membrane protein